MQANLHLLIAGAKDGKSEWSRSAIEIPDDSDAPLAIARIIPRASVAFMVQSPKGHVLAHGGFDATNPEILSAVVGRALSRFRILAFRSVVAPVAAAENQPAIEGCPGNDVVLIDCTELHH